MSNKTKIEWADKTWNPVTGCSKVSSGCKNCYAEVMAKRLRSMGANGYDNGFKLSLMPRRLLEPFNSKNPTSYFVCSMSDLFHQNIPTSFLDDIFNTIKNTPHHRYMILTKRPHHAARYFKDNPVPNNVLLGVSVENIKEGLPRIDVLKTIPAKIRFLSIEPLLEDLERVDFSGIHWVIVGGESGGKARRMYKRWVVNIKDQCEQQNIPFFFKQWGAYGADGKKASKKSNGALLNNKIHHSYPLNFN